MDGYITIGTEINTKDFDKQITYIESKMDDIEHKLKQADMGFEVGDVQKLEAEYEKLGNQLIVLKQKQEKYNQSVKEASNGGLQNIGQQLNNIGSKVEDVTKKVGRWALAVFGVRTAFSAVRSAMSTLSQYDDQMSTNLEYMRFVLANAIKPVIETIINLAYTLLVYLNEILNAWFGINIFSKEATKQFVEHVNSSDKQAKNMKKTAKAAKDLKKSLTGFDEMNVLQDNKSDSGAGGGGAGGAKIGDAGKIKMPEFPDVKVPKWITFIAKNGKYIVAILAGIAGGLIAIKLGFSAIQALGIGIAIAGIILTIEKIIDFINDPTFDNFIGILKGIAIAVAGVAIAFGAWPVAIGAAIALLVLLIVKHFDKIKAMFEKAIKWIDKNVLGALRDLFGPLGDILFIPIKYFVELAKGAFESFFGGIKTVINGVMKIFKGDFLGGIKDIFGGLLKIMTAPLQGFIKAVIKVWEQIKESVKYWGVKFKEKFDEIKDFFMKPINNFVNGVKNIWGKIKDAVGGLKDKIGEKFNAIKDFFMKPINNFIEGIKGLWDKIKGTIADVAKKIGDALNPANIVDNIKKGAKNIVSGGAKKIKKLFSAKGSIIVPKLASGGIINQPGRGVPLASAYGGERGAEGVIPLTDSQQMALLGEAIGKYITINANITNTMNGRVISREIQRINAEQDFAYNR